MFHNHYETHFPSRNPTPIQGFHFEVLPRNILSFLSFPKPLRNSNPDLRELTRFRGQVWFGIPGKFLLIFALWENCSMVYSVYSTCLCLQSSFLCIHPSPGFYKYRKGAEIFCSISSMKCTACTTLGDRKIENGTFSK